MKCSLTTLMLTFLTCISSAQDYTKVDSLIKVLNETANDTNRVKAMHEISYNYLYSKPDSSAWFAQNALTLAKRVDYPLGVIRSLNDIGNALNSLGSYSEAIKILLQALEESEKLNDENSKAISLANISEAYYNHGDYRQAIRYNLRSLSIDLKNRDTIYLILDYLNLGNYYEKVNLVDSALAFANQAYQLALQVNYVDQMGGILISLGNIHVRLGNIDIALPFYRKAVLASQLVGNLGYLSRSYLPMAKLFKQLGFADSSLFFGKKAFETSFIASDNKGVYDATALLSSLYEKISSDSTIKYLKLNIAMKDSLFSHEKARQVQSLTINEQLRESRLQEEKDLAEEKRRRNIQLAAIAAFIPAFFGIVLMLSKRKVKPRTIEFMGLVGLLFFFEFIQLYLHPHLGTWTHHTPVFMLLLQVLVAALLVPMHHRLESWVKDKLAHPDKQLVQPIAIETLPDKPADIEKS